MRDEQKTPRSPDPVGRAGPSDSGAVLRDAVPASSGLAREAFLIWLERSYHLLPIDVERERVAQLVGDSVEEQLP